MKHLITVEHIEKCEHHVGTCQFLSGFLETHPLRSLLFGRPTIMKFILISSSPTRFSPLPPWE
ncbi:hypothetical protein CAEBREN_16188 [Caenorhabditis brenneri]|uniref:Uncharacterized protein n=1 Tax=Caenorhabditis brenneri TaxID=135651 RepID=G0NMP7_CAEBE|nr:hypothetical protein CAEBREN_16188 [Caenorhabditis brenneri]